jgi:PAS domain S-box-containing protein
MFRLVRFFAVMSFIVLVAAMVVLGFFYRQSSINDLIALGENKNVDLTRAFVNSLWSQFEPFVAAASGLKGDELRSRSDINELRQATLKQMRGLSVVKIKVYNLDGLTVFSTDIKQIGEDKSGNAGFISARAGKTVSELTHRDTFSAFENTIENRDVISSYIPIQLAGSEGPIEGVFEVYDDVTPLLKRIEQTQRTVMAGVILVLAMLYIALFFIVRYADKVIERQRLQREQAERAQHESEIRLRTVVNSAPIMLWAVDTMGRLTLLEGKGLSTLKLKPEAAIGQPVADVFREIPQIAQEVQRTLSGHQFASLLIMNECTFDTWYTPLRAQSGEMTGVIGVATDITERMLAEEALGEAHSNLEKQNQELKRVHELFRSTLEHIAETVQRGAPKTELFSYVDQVQLEFNRLGC